MRAQTLGYQILRRARELLRRLGLVERSGRNSILSRGSSRTSQLEPDPLACLDWTQCLLIGPNANTAWASQAPRASDRSARPWAGLWARGLRLSYHRFRYYLKKYGSWAAARFRRRRGKVAVPA